MQTQITYVIVGNIKRLSHRVAREISIVHNVTDDVENCREGVGTRSHTYDIISQRQSTFWSVLDGK